MYAKKINPLVWVIPLAVILLLVAVVVWGLTQYQIVDFRFYSKDTEILDLREEEISVSHYEKLAEKLPDAEIYWNVPFQGAVYSSDTTSLTITELTMEDVPALVYLEKLESVDAVQCTDYEALAELENQRPEVKIDYQIQLGDQSFDRSLTELALTEIAQEELPRLAALRKLESVTFRGNQMESAAALQNYCHENGLQFFLELGGNGISDSTKDLTLTGAAEEELSLLPLLTKLETLMLRNPQMPQSAVEDLKKAYPKVAITVETVIGGKTIDPESVVVDLSDVTVESLEEAEQCLNYLPKVESVFFGLQELDNDELAAFRERSRDKYKVVWEVTIGETATLRTDITYFMPGRDWARGPTFGDDISYNLRYCEDLICVDVGHLGSVKEVTWLEGLVNLEYLILAHTDIRSLEGIQNCKKLKFLELDWTGIRDLTPLKECTALEDLNIGKAYPDVTPLFEMPWLKNVYMIYGSSSDAYRVSQALPDTHVVASGNATVASGWRNLPNYYAMRDALHAPYMKG